MYVHMSIYIHTYLIVEPAKRVPSFTRQLCLNLRASKSFLFSLVTAESLLPQPFAWQHMGVDRLSHIEGFYGICYRTISRTLISNLGYKAALIGIKLPDQGSKFKSCRKSRRKFCRKSCSKIM